MAATLTPHQRTVLSYIREFQHKRGYSPSLADLAVAFGVKSKNAIAKVVNVLARGKHLKKDPKGRIKIFERDDDARGVFAALTLPLFGPIAAGFAAPVEEQAEETVTLEDYLVSDRSNTFLLRVKGDSMIDAGIQEGDLIVAERGREPRVGDIVVAVLDDQYTLKRLARQDGKYYLKAENAKYPAMHPREELTIAGIVKGVLRKY